MFEMIAEAPKVVDILEELNINNDHYELADKQLIMKRK